MFSRDDLHFEYHIDGCSIRLDEHNEILDLSLDRISFDQLITDETRRKIEEIESQEHHNKQMSYEFFNRPGTNNLMRLTWHGY